MLRILPLLFLLPLVGCEAASTGTSTTRRPPMSDGDAGIDDPPLSDPPSMSPLAGLDAGAGCSVDPDCVGDACNVCDPEPDPEPDPGPDPICGDAPRATLTFRDRLDGDNDGQIIVFGDRDPTTACAELFVEVTGYYDLYDVQLAESCREQRDEVGYVTVENRCNPSGNPTDGNVGRRFVVPDLDNTRDCRNDSDCGGGNVCRRGNGGRCCVPSEPAHLGRFVLAAGEPNVLCAHHFCEDWRSGAGGDAFINEGCTDRYNSIHFRLDDNAAACLDGPELDSCP